LFHWASGIDFGFLEIFVGIRFVPVVVGNLVNGILSIGVILSLEGPISQTRELPVVSIVEDGLMIGITRQGMELSLLISLTKYCPSPASPSASPVPASVLIPRAIRYTLQSDHTIRFLLIQRVGRETV
jgi:hypothetical protein